MWDISTHKYVEHDIRIFYVRGVYYVVDNAERDTSIASRGGHKAQLSVSVATYDMRVSPGAQAVRTDGKNDSNKPASNEPLARCQ